MTGFFAGFNGTRIFINGEKEYQLGEILTKYLSKNFKGLEDIHFRCKRYAGILRYPETQSETSGFSDLLLEAIHFYDRIEDMICSLPPYNAIKPKRNALRDILEEYGWLFEDEYDDESGERLDYHDRYSVSLALDDFDKADMIDGILEFDSKLKALATEYLTFIEDIMRVKAVYEPFLEKLHSESRYLDNTETAQVLYDFNGSTMGKMKAYEKLKPSGKMQLSYTVIYKKADLKSKVGTSSASDKIQPRLRATPILCEQYQFDTIGAFLYIELFKGLEMHYLPKKCGYCGKYFLLEAGIFSDYCTRTIANMEGKVCRDMGHRKKYADKLKNNPVWNVYNKAYKQHYARYLKKKMTQAEFQQWADYALELRSKAENGELEFEEYRGLIRV